MSKTKFDTNHMLRKEWRELGFYYQNNIETREWLFIGCKSGLLKFIDCIDEHIKYQSSISSDSHFGPYSYLKLMTWKKPYIDLKVIAGREYDFRNLQSIYKRGVNSTEIGNNFIIDEDYSLDNLAAIRVEIMKDDFDPVSMDSEL